MINAGVAGDIVFNEKAYYLSRSCGSLSDSLGDILRTLAHSREEHARRGRLYGTKLGMSLCEEVVRIHRSGKLCRKRSCGFIGLYRCSENNHIRVDMELLVRDEVRSLNHELAVVRSDFSYHALDVMYAVLLNRSSVELVKVLSGRSYVYIEYVYVCIGILFSCKHSVLCGIHAAYLRAVRLAAAVVRTGAHALYKYDCMRMLAVGGT